MKFNDILVMLLKVLAYMECNEITVKECREVKSTRRLIITIKHRIEVRRRRCQNNFMSGDDFTSDRELDITKLCVHSHAIYGAERGDAVTGVLVMSLWQKFFANGRWRSHVARRLGRVVLDAVINRRAVQEDTVKTKCANRIKTLKLSKPL